MAEQVAGAVAPANQEAVRAWDTVLYERWRKHREVFVGSLEPMTDEFLKRYPPPVGGRCIDIGCGFGETARQLAGLVGPQGFVLGTDSSPHFVEDARQEAADADVENVEFEASDAQTAHWEPVYDYAFSRTGTMFFALPVQAMRAIRGSLKPGGELHKIVWNRKNESPLFTMTEAVVLEFLSRPEEYEADTCGPGPFSMGNPETLTGILEASGFEDIKLEQHDFDYLIGRDIDEALAATLAIGPGAELIRLNGEHGESLKPEIASALAERYAELRRPDGTIVNHASVWFASAKNPAS